MHQYLEFNNLMTFCCSSLSKGTLGQRVRLISGLEKSMQSSGITQLTHEGPPNPTMSSKFQTRPKCRHSQTAKQRKI